VSSLDWLHVDCLGSLTSPILVLILGGGLPVLHLIGYLISLLDLT
jgi:hypothetical protein